MSLRSALISTLLLSSAAGMASSGCNYVDIDYQGLEAFDVPTNILMRVARPDGTQVPNLVQWIEENYGFRAQTMTFVVPELTVEIYSNINAGPENLDIEIIVTDWKTTSTEVVNDVQSVPFNLHVNGAPTVDCVTADSDSNPDNLPRCSDLKASFGAIVDAIAVRVADELKNQLSLAILDDTESQVLHLFPAQASFQCTVDETAITDVNESYHTAVYSLDGAVRCAAQALVALPE